MNIAISTISNIAISTRSTSNGTTSSYTSTGTILVVLLVALVVALLVALVLLLLAALVLVVAVVRCNPSHDATCLTPCAIVDVAFSLAPHARTRARAHASYRPAHSCSLQLSTLLLLPSAHEPLPSASRQLCNSSYAQPTWLFAGSGGV